MTAFLLALAAAACFGGALVVTHFGLRHAAPLPGAAVSIALTAIAWWSAAWVLVDWSELHYGALIVFALVGLFYPGAVTLLTYESNRVLGPTLTGTASSTTPVFAVACSILLLGERPAVAVILGGLVIVAGLALLAMKAPLERPPGWRLLLPLSSAALRGAAQSLIKLGLTLWPSAFAATLMTYTTSAAAMAIAAGASPAGSRHFTRKALPWFAGVAALNGTAVLLMCYALQHGSVGVVSPIVATYPLFTMLFSAALLREERFTQLGILGAGLTVTGAMLVAMG